ncbi:MAG TPA: DMT family transporter [Alphaproteobacteria bacterium]|nr:DMT family transporter [Alphaproteobacteria bacterium]
MSLAPALPADPARAPMAPLLLLIATGALLGGNFALAKIAGAAGIPALGYAFWQSFGGGLVLLVLARFRLPLAPRFLRYYAVTGLVSMALPNAVIVLTVPKLGTGLAALAYAFPPLLTYGLALGLRVERFQAVRAAGILMGLAGALMILGPRGGLPDPGLWGWMLLALAAPVAIAAGNIYRSLDWPEGAAPQELAAGMLLASALWLTPAVWLAGSFHMPGGNPADWTLLVQIANSALTFVLYFALQKRAGPVYFSQLGYVTTVTGLAAGWLAFGERYGPLVFAAVAVIFSGVFLVNRKPAK